MRASASTLLTLATLLASTPAPVLAADPVPRTSDITAAVAEASIRFGIPTAWIEAVMAAESHGQSNAISPKGAMGLMQLMPGTWRELRADLELGSDPFNRRDNVVAGAAYLRKLYDRYGYQGFLAAYNAGPGRYRAFVEGARRLPPETIAYVARVEARIARSGGQMERARLDWRHAALFPQNAEAASADDLTPTMVTIVEGLEREKRP